MRVIYNKSYNLEAIMKVINFYLFISEETININVRYILDTNFNP